MRIAVIDLGTNTFNLLIAEIHDDSSYDILFKEELSVKLCEGSISRKFISEAPFERGLSAIEKHLATARKFKADFIEAYATSAIRSAENGKIFTDSVFSKYRLKINIIDGNREAELIYKGVRLALDKKTDENYIIMDIGGGSTEFILFNNNEMLWKKSFDLGVARLFSVLNPQNPVSAKDLKHFENYLKENLTPLFNAHATFNFKNLIGCSGSFESFHSIINQGTINPYDEMFSKMAEINIKDFSKIHDLLIKSTEQERLTINGLVSMRADTIHIASFFVKYIISKLKIEKLILSHYALKEGVLAEYISKFSQ